MNFFPKSCAYIPLCWQRSKSSGISLDTLYNSSSKNFAPHDGNILPSFVLVRCAILVNWFKMKGLVNCFLFPSSGEEDDGESDEESESDAVSLKWI